MSKKGTSGARADVPDGLDAHVAEFLAKFVASGYAATTQQDKRRSVVSFVRWVEDSRIRVGALDERCVAAFLRRRMSRHRKDQAPSVLHQFLEHLRDAGVVPRRSSKPSATEMRLRRYLDHLRDNQGLCRRSLEVYGPFVRTFIAAKRLPKGLAALDAVVVRRYLIEHARDRSVPYVKLLRAALRSFLRFCFMDGMVWADLSTAIPLVHRWQHAPLPPCLTAEEVERVIAAAERSTARGRRDFAILLLLARLGLRAGEIVALELDDIRWASGELLVRGKGRLHDRLPLPQDVGAALAVYLRQARPRSVSRRVFLRRIAPHVALSGPTAVCVVAREALQRAGLRPAGRVGAHIFRHSLATQMVRHGASLAEVSQVLRHRSIQATQLYARVDVDALRGVALPWPGAEVRQ
jgi:site-specific recombinase XerD